MSPRSFFPHGEKESPAGDGSRGGTRFLPLLLSPSLGNTGRNRPSTIDFHGTA
ncbi:hypothetical protein B296_00011673 [Ensete ventricosum]|uniref:Uncharacterized protein n=1 Tax=Ensete ventricosum TaxID=4639 RepID=A0A427B9K5_ENSVE|nr:hypothetical protein B296_00011673 [Ensete ventricosum]